MQLLIPLRTFFLRRLKSCIRTLAHFFPHRLFTHFVAVGVLKRLYSPPLSDVYLLRGYLPDTFLMGPAFFSFFSPHRSWTAPLLSPPFFKRNSLFFFLALLISQRLAEKPRAPDIHSEARLCEIGTSRFVPSFLLIFFFFFFFLRKGFPFCLKLFPLW